MHRNAARVGWRRSICSWPRPSISSPAAGTTPLPSTTPAWRRRPWSAPVGCRGRRGAAADPGPSGRAGTVASRHRRLGSCAGGPTNSGCRWCRWPRSCSPRHRAGPGSVVDLARRAGPPDRRRAGAVGPAGRPGDRQGGDAAGEANCWPGWPRTPQRVPTMRHWHWPPAVDLVRAMADVTPTGRPPPPAHFGSAGMPAAKSVHGRRPRSPRPTAEIQGPARIRPPAASNGRGLGAVTVERRLTARLRRTRCGWGSRVLGDDRPAGGAALRPPNCRSLNSSGRA